MRGVSVAVTGHGRSLAQRAPADRAMGAEQTRTVCRHG
jgi:hypothetical protein